MRVASLRRCGVENVFVFESLIKFEYYFSEELFEQRLPERDYTFRAVREPLIDESLMGDRAIQDGRQSDSGKTVDIWA